MFLIGSARDSSICCAVMDHGQTGKTREHLTAAHTIDAGAAALRAGKLVAFPTETVYGLGADATNDHAVAAIFEAKGRPRFNPLIIHLPDREQASSLAIWTPLADRLAQQFWPGPLTLVLEKCENSPVSMLANAGGATIALRTPDHPITLALLRKTGLPIAGPSANPAGRISPTTADHVIQGLGDRVEVVIDGGAASIGVESTVLDLSTPTPCLLRPGGLPRETIEAVIGNPLITKDVTESDDQALRSPGQLPSHYAPHHPVRLDAHHVRADEALLAFGQAPIEGAAYTLNLSKSGDLREAAGNLFAMLHELDRQSVLGIAVMPIPATGLGEAIRDRLKRAAIRP